MDGKRRNDSDGDNVPEATAVIKENCTGYPGPEHLNLHALFCFNYNDSRHTKLKKWRKSKIIMWSDSDTKIMVEKLLRPFQDYSQFIRHLISVEEYWRAGDLVISTTASATTLSYFKQVLIRISACKSLPSNVLFNLQSRKQHQSPSKGQREWKEFEAIIRFPQKFKEIFKKRSRSYGNDSSFFRHLILLEKHWRAGDLVISSTASSKTINYINRMKNRIQLEGFQTSCGAQSLGSTSAIPAMPHSSNLPAIYTSQEKNFSFLKATDESLNSVSTTNVSTYKNLED